jgi:hypothetical protein
MSRNYYQNSIYFRRQIYKLLSFVEDGELSLSEEDVKVVVNFLNGTIRALNIYERPQEKSIPRLMLIK